MNISINLSITEYEFLLKKIKEEFDTPMKFYDSERDKMLIELAEKFGMKELASQMRIDAPEQIITY